MTHEIKEEIKDLEKSFHDDFFPFQMAEDSRVFDIIYNTEKVADQILTNKHELVNWDKKRQGNREALRELKKSGEKKVWITVGTILVQTERIKAIEVLMKGLMKKIDFVRIFNSFYSF
jgi:chaperonin cofactor prefoldin